MSEPLTRDMLVGKHEEPEPTSAGPAWTAGSWAWVDLSPDTEEARGLEDANGNSVLWSGYDMSCWCVSVTSYIEVKEANARLISAAPDLYEALEELTRATYADTFADRPTKRMSDALNAAAAALAKATGQ